MNAKNNYTIVLVHGLGRTHFSMWRIERYLKLRGHKVLNWRYNSFTAGIVDLGYRLAEYLQQSLPEDSRIHGVGHSLGGLILRQTFTVLAQPGQRLVTMGTPHHGASIIARNNWLFNNRFTPQAVREMHPDSKIIRTLPFPNCEIGVIAGVQRLHLLNPVSWINCLTHDNSRHDGTVDIESTVIANSQDYAEVSANHSFIPNHPLAIEYTENFIRTGKFHH